MSDATTRTSAGGAGTIIRRIVLFALLFTLVVVAAVGLSGLLERVIGTGGVIAEGDAGLARALAFTFIGTPLAAALWWWQRRRLATDASERASLVWALYLSAMTVTSLIVATVALATAATAGIQGEWRPGDASAGIVWTGIWLWHRHMRRSATTAPARLADLPIELGAVYGLVVSASGAIAAVSTLLSQALGGATVVLASSEDWILPALQALVWCGIGAIVWWWHWFRERASEAPGAFAAVLLVIVVGLAAATTLFALGTVLFVLLRLLFDTDSVAKTLEPLDVAVAAALVGAIVWVYHHRVLATRSEAARNAGRLVVSAIALVGAASGFGVVVNALLATLGPTLVDADTRTLLLGGISALAVGGPAWWLAWRPDRRSETDAADPARRVYLVAVFGASAVVGLVTVLIIGYQLFEFALGDGGGAGLVERIRAPLGLFSATAVVFGYHFAVWRRDRAAAPRAARRQIGRVVLVTAGDADAYVAQIRAATGAAVTVWAAADADAHLTDEAMPGLIESLHTLSAPRVLIVAESGGGSRVTPLAD